MDPTVLLVDDDETYLKTLRRLFRHQPFSLELASSAEEGLDILKTSEVSVVISDESMPQMPGSAFLAQVARLHPDTIRISLTGQASIEAAQRSINEGQVFRYLTKPVEARALAETIFEGLAMRDLQLARRLTDPVSGLPNERALIEYVDRLRSGPAPAYRHVLLLYGFERLQDLLSAVLDEAGQRKVCHEIGQRLLEASEQTIDLLPSTMTIDFGAPDDGLSLKSKSAFVARCGADEFALVLQPSTDGDAQLMAEALTRALEHAVIVQERSVFLSARCGVVGDVADHPSGEAALAAARTALSETTRSSDARRPARVYHPALSAKLISQTSFEADLHEALEANAFEVYYQPIFAPQGDEAIAAEALLRWRHPTIGWISPEKVVKVAEERGLINRLTMQTLRRACLQQVAWSRRGCDLKMSVNVSATEFAQGRMVARIAREVNNAGMNPERLQLEITESVVIQNPREAVAVRNELREAGIKVALDDFGTGYSSLGYLKMLKPDTLKIDRSFVTNVAHDPETACMLESVVKMALDLGMRIVAEGVETTEDRDYLARLGVHELQGYLYARPAPAADLDGLLFG